MSVTVTDRPTETVLLKADAEVSQPKTAFVFTGQGSAEVGLCEGRVVPMCLLHVMVSIVAQHGIYHYERCVMFVVISVANIPKK